MTADNQDQQQNFFKAVTAPGDRSALIRSIVNSQTPLQLKPEGARTLGPQDLTVVRADSAEGETVTATFVSGPTLKPGEMTIALESDRALYFCTGTLVSVEDQSFVVFFKKIFELQRRDAYRVSIPEKVIKANIKITKINGAALDKDYRIADLSAGGLGIAADDTNAAFLPVGAIFEGVIKVGSHAPVIVTGTVKHQRKSRTSSSQEIHVGCAFLAMNVALNDKISFLVNDCHRISFSKLPK